VKFYLSGDEAAISRIPPNSIPDMIAMTIATISLLAAVFVFAEYISWRRNNKDE
jgi:hypothetical protein